MSQELLQKVSANPREISDRSHEAEMPDERFRELLQVTAIDEKPRDQKACDRGLFSIFEEEEEKEPQLESPCLMPQMMPTAMPFTPSLLMPCQEIGSTAPVVPLSVDIEALFEKMASCMIVMSSSHEVETTLFLDNPSSIFCGTRITIREFSTAPKTFNIEIASNAQAVNTIDAARSSLLAAFQQSKFNFSIHRFDTQIQRSSERPVFHRKENTDQDQKGGREP